MAKDLRKAPVKYGWIKGGNISTVVEMGSSALIKATGGNFVTLDSSGHAAISSSTSATVFGYIAAGAQTCSSTAGGTHLNCIIDPSAIFRIPVNSGTYTNAMMGETCDLSVSSDIQGAALDASSYDIVQIVGGDETNNKYVDVRLIPAKTIATGVV